MRKVLTAVAAAAIIGLTALASSSPAEAWGRWGWGPGWGWRGGWGWGPGPFWGGVAAGAVVGGAIAAAPYYPYGYYYGYGCRPVWNGYYWVRGCY